MQTDAVLLSREVNRSTVSKVSKRLPLDDTVFQHECKLKTHSDIHYKLDEEFKKNKWLKYRVISKVNPKTIMHFKSLTKKRLEILRHLEHYYYKIHPYSIIRLKWEIFMCFIYFLFIMEIFIHVGFEVKILHNLGHSIYHSIMCFMCWADIFVNLRSGYMKIDGHEYTAILCSRKILWHYLRTFLIFDIVSSIPFEVIFLAIEKDEQRLLDILNITKWLYLLKIVRFTTIFKYLNCLTQYLNITDISSKILRMGLSIIIIPHIATCFLAFVIKKIECESPHYWGNITTFNDKSLRDQYIICALTMYTHIFGSQLAQVAVHKSQGEKLLECVLILCNLGFILYMIVTIKQIQDLRNASRTEYGQIMNQIEEFMRHRQLPLNIQSRLTNFYKYRFRNSFFREDKLLGELSAPLRSKIVLHCGKLFVERTQVFQDVSRSVLSNIVSCLVSEVYLPNDTITRAGTIGDCMYFIASGTVTVTTPTGYEICHLEDGDHFGEIALIMKDKKRLATVVAVEYCNVYRLDQIHFLKHISSVPFLLERFEATAIERINTTRHFEDKHKKELLEKRISISDDA